MTFPSPTNTDKGVLDLFVDEAGDPTLFANRRRPIVGTAGCSRYFMLGKLDVDDPTGLAERLNTLRERMCRHPYFTGVPSFNPTRRKTALVFHAKDDLPEVRFQVLDMLMQEGSRLRFHAVVCDKMAELARVQARNAIDTQYRYHANELYDHLMRSLFGKFHRMASRYRVYIARRGASDRNEAMKTAIVEHAEADFMTRFGFRRGDRDAWQIKVTTPEHHESLQAVDYFLWALQRFYEPRPDPVTGAPRREDRFLRMLWPQIGEIHDLHFGPVSGTFFNTNREITLTERFTEETKKEKS